MKNAINEIMYQTLKQLNELRDQYVEEHFNSENDPVALAFLKGKIDGIEAAIEIIRS